MLMVGNEGTFCVTLNNREPEPTSLDSDKVLLGSPINIVAASPKVYLQFISIIIHPFNAIDNQRTLLLAMLSPSLCTKQQCYAYRKVFTFFCK